MEDPIIQANLSIIKTYQSRGIVIKKGKGVYLYDDKNQKYLDLMSNYGANILGHCHHLLVKNLTYQIKTLTNLHGSFINDIRSKAAYLLKSKKQKILYFSKAYHGKTLLSLAVTDSEKYKKGIPTYFEKNLVKVEYNNEKDLEGKFTDEVGVVIVELIQGDGGINEAKKSFIKKIEELSQKFGAIFIVDEIQTGAGRTGKFFASEYYNTKPDIVLLGKGIAGGIPCSVILIKEKYQDLIEKGFQTSTFAGNPLSACGIFTVLKVLTPSFLDKVEKTGQFFKESLKNHLEKKGYQVRGKGLMIGVETFKNNQTEILKKLQSEKILAIPASTNVIRFLPPLIIDKKTIEKNLKKIVNCF